MKMKAFLPAATAALLLVSACSTGPDGDTGDDLLPTVVVSSYPLEFIAAAVGGEAAAVTNLVPAGAEPHDFELSPADVATMERADLVINVGGFQPAVDSATAEIEGTIDLAAHLDLQSRDGHLDPHFWLDPGRMVLAAEQIAAALTDAAPDAREQFAANLTAVTGELTELDSAFRQGLGGCTYDTFVTGHAAFGYLADSYGLTEIAIAGIDPETEPSPAALAQTREEVGALGLPAIFAEPGDTKVAEVLAEELGIESEILHPVEAVAPGEDYISLMYSNLAALKIGLQCP